MIHYIKYSTSCINGAKAKENSLGEGISSLHIPMPNSLMFFKDSVFVFLEGFL